MCSVRKDPIIRFIVAINRLTKTNENQKQMRTPKAKYITAMLVAIAGFALQQAKADLFTSSLDTGNSAIAGFLQPGEQFGTVTVSVSGTTATITFTANTGGGFEFIDTSAAAVNLASGIDPSTATIVTDTEFKAFDSGKNVDGFGVFNLSVNNKDGSGSPVDTIVFNVDVASGTAAADVLALNGNGFDAAAHISVNGGVATGFAGEGPQGHIPDGGTTAMFMGLGLSALGVVRRFLIG